MNLRPFQRHDPDINLTALIDVVFLLLIFFMVSTTFNRESEIAVDLPEASAAPVENKDVPLEITIDAGGHFFVNQEAVVNTKITTLKAALQHAMRDRKSGALTISADGRTPHQAVITAMDAARQLGIAHLSLATKQRKNAR